MTYLQSPTGPVAKAKIESRSPKSQFSAHPTTWQLLDRPALVLIFDTASEARNRYDLLRRFLSSSKLRHGRGSVCEVVIVHLLSVVKELQSLD